MTALIERPQTGSLVQQFEYGLDAPICLTWELTYACNLECAHCYIAAGPAQSPDGDLPTAERRSWFNTFVGVQAYERGTEDSALLGGETVDLSLQTREVDGRTIDLQPPFARMTVCEAFERYADIAGAEAVGMLGILHRDVEGSIAAMEEALGVEPGIEGVTRALLVFSVLPTVIALVWYFERARWHRVLRALRTVDV